MMCGMYPLDLGCIWPLAVLIVTVGEVMEMEQVLHLGLMHAWASIWGGGEEGFARTKMFLRLDGC